MLGINCQLRMARIDLDPKVIFSTHVLVCSSSNGTVIKHTCQIDGHVKLNLHWLSCLVCLELANWQYKPI